MCEGLGVLSQGLRKGCGNAQGWVPGVSPRSSVWAGGACVEAAAVQGLGCGQGGLGTRLRVWSGGRAQRVKSQAVGVRTAMVALRVWSDGLRGGQEGRHQGRHSSAGLRGWGGDYLAKVEAPHANTPLGIAELCNPNSNHPPACLGLVNIPDWEVSAVSGRAQEAMVMPQALGVLGCPTRGPQFPSPAQPSSTGASP